LDGNPLALGTVGGLTSLHPLVKLSLEMLEKSKRINAVCSCGRISTNFAACSLQH
jgi:hydroxymethylglutaryl-CoA reductase